jgi:hypothetical protein
VRQKKTIKEERDSVEIDSNSEHMLSQCCYVMVASCRDIDVVIHIQHIIIICYFYIGYVISVFGMFFHHGWLVQPLVALKKKLT